MIFLLHFRYEKLVLVQIYWKIKKQKYEQINLWQLYVLRCKIVYVLEAFQLHLHDCAKFPWNMDSLLNFRENHIPLLKAGSFTNYRGISKHNTKSLKKNLYSIIYVITHPLFCRLINMVSVKTITNLLHFTSIINYTNFNKAFDKVNHGCLLHKFSLKTLK